MGTRGARPMLVAKTTMVPPTRAGVVLRPRLHERLRNTGSGPCTVVVAPAGWGKSTLLSTWAHDPAEHRRVGWVSLDETDDEPVRFWTCAITALAAVAPELTAEPLAALEGQGLDTVDVAVPALLNALTATEDEYVLVLDDYPRPRRPSDPRERRVPSVLPATGAAPGHRLPDRPAPPPGTVDQPGRGLWATGERSAVRTALDHAHEVSRIDPPRPHAAAQLADRELAVLRALRGPLSAREIGRELHLSINTIKGYSKSLYRKLGVVTRSDAVTRGHDLGLI